MEIVVLQSQRSVHLERELDRMRLDIPSQAQIDRIDFTADQALATADRGQR